jgi:hypothetical protein
LIYPDDNEKSFQVNSGFRIHGGAGRWEYMPKHSFRLYFRSEYGAAKLQNPIFPDSPLEDFDTLILKAGTNRSFAGYNNFKHNQAVYARDEWARRTQIEMSGDGSHGIFVHLYINGLYWGLYNVMERPDESFISTHFGGREEDWYVFRDNEYLRDGPDEGLLILEQSLIEAFSILDRSEGYAKIKSHIDIDQFIDYLILNWYIGSRDWPEDNWYAAMKKPADKLMFFVWDAESTWDDGAQIVLKDEKLDDYEDNPIAHIFIGLMRYPEFRIEFADRVFKHLSNDGALTDANAQARWLQLTNNIEQAIIAESARWGDARVENPITPGDWLKARDNVLEQMEGNGDKLIALLREANYYPAIDPPLFSRHSDPGDPNLKLNMTASAGKIYYTTDGTDPRVPIEGTISGRALPFISPLAITSTTTIMARTFADGIWSVLHENTFEVFTENPGLLITEIMYNPVGGSDLEFIEIKNVSDVDVSLANMYFEGINFNFPVHVSLEPGEFMVLASDHETFVEQYPGAPVGGSYRGQLSNGGERIVLKDADGKVITSVEYDDEGGWPISADGRGDSLVFINSNGDPNDPKNWRASTDLNGSPGTDDLHVKR